MEVEQLRIQVVQDNLMEQKHIKNNHNRSPRKHINSILTLFFCSPSPHTFAAWKDVSFMCHLCVISDCSSVKSRRVSGVGRDLASPSSPVPRRSRTASRGYKVSPNALVRSEAPAALSGLLVSVLYKQNLWFSCAAL